MDLKDILIAFPAEELNTDQAKRDFWIPEESGTSAHFFSYLESTREIEISSKSYSLNDPELMSRIEEKFSKFEIHEQENAKLADKFNELKNNQALIRKIDFLEGQDLDSIQIQKYRDSKNPDKLEHFTDWLTDYIEQTKIWQVRYPKRIVKISLVDDAVAECDESSIGVFSKYAIFENMDTSEEKYFLKIDFLYDLSVEGNCPDNPEFEFFESRVFFAKENTCIDPSELDDFDFWYRILILGEDPYEDDDDHIEDIDIEA